MSKLGPAVGLRPTTLTPDEMRAARAERNFLWRVEIERKLAWRDGFKTGTMATVLAVVLGLGLGLLIWTLLEGF